MKHFIEFILERGFAEYWDCDSISKNDIMKLLHQAIEDIDIKPNDIQEEILKYKEFDDLIRAYNNDELDNYAKLENAMYNLLEKDNHYKGQVDNIMDHVFIHIIDLMKEYTIKK